MSVVAEILALFDIKYTEVGGGCVTIFENKKAGNIKGWQLQCGMLCRLDMRKLPLLSSGNQFLILSFSGSVCTCTVQNTASASCCWDAHTISLFKEGELYCRPGTVCIVSKITDGFILPFWRGFPHEEKVKLQHVICTTVKELERKKTVGTDTVFTHVHLYSCRKTVSKWPIRIRHEGTYTVKWKILFQRFLIIIRGFN